MPDVWVVMSTVRLKQSLEMVRLVLKTPANLAIAVHEDKNIFNQLKKALQAGSNHFILEFGSYPGQVPATNGVYGQIREIDPSNNILFVPETDDMPPIDGWYRALVGCFSNLKDGVGVLSGYDGHGASGFGGITAKYCDIYQKGWLHCPEYFQWWVDHELVAVSEAHGKRFRCRGATAYHQMLDNQANISHPNWRRDNKTLTRRRKSMFSYENIKEAPWRYWKNP